MVSNMINSKSFCFRAIRFLYRRSKRIIHLLTSRLIQIAIPLIDPIYSIYLKKKKSNILYAIYDLSVSPATYDILPFLYSAEICRIKKRCNFIHLIILTGDEDGFRKGSLNAYNANAKSPDSVNLTDLQGRLMNIVIPCYQILPTVKSVSYFGMRDESFRFLNSTNLSKYPEKYHIFAPVMGYGFQDIFRMDDLLEYNVVFKAPGYALKYVDSWLKERSEGKKIVTITLRESVYEERRNSLVNEWIKFADEIIKIGFFPVFIRDTEKNMKYNEKPLSEYVTIPEASIHVPIRMALYDRAYLNMAVSGGPPVYSVCNRNNPYLLFKLVAGYGSTNENHFKQMGVEPGTQPQICGPFQKWVWKEDTFEVILDEFLKMVEKIEAQR